MSKQAEGLRLQALRSVIGWVNDGEFIKRFPYAAEDFCHDTLKHLQDPDYWGSHTIGSGYKEGSSYSMYAFTCKMSLLNFAEVKIYACIQPETGVCYVPKVEYETAERCRHHCEVKESQFDAELRFEEEKAAAIECVVAFYQEEMDPVEDRIEGLKPEDWELVDYDTRTHGQRGKVLTYNRLRTAGGSGSFLDPGSVKVFVDKDGDMIASEAIWSRKPSGVWAMKEARKPEGYGDWG